jgi:hypothetical protein
MPFLLKGYLNSKNHVRKPVIALHRVQLNYLRLKAKGLLSAKAD